jgi:hypothetical protein
MSENKAELKNNDGNQGRLAANHPLLYHYTNAHAFRSIVMRIPCGAPITRT